MIKLIFRVMVSGLAVFISAYFLPGVHLDSYWIALLAALVIGILNLLVKPFLVLLSLPITFLTFGLFTLVIDAGLLLLAAYAISEFTIDGFGTALLFALVLAFVTSLLNTLLRTK